MSPSPKIFFMVRVGSFKMADVICQIRRLAVEIRTMAVLILYLLSSERQMTVFYWGSISMYLLRHIFLMFKKHCHDTFHLICERKGSRYLWAIISCRNKKLPPKSKPTSWLTNLRTWYNLSTRYIKYSWP